MGEKRIGGREFRCTPIPAKEAFMLLGEIIQLTGSASKHVPNVIYAALHGEDETEEGEVKWLRKK